MQRLRPFLLIAFVMAVLLTSWVFKPDDLARQDTRAGLQRAAATFATARTLHAALSVAQGTQIAVEPGGVGAVFTPGQALKPVTELLEQFSTLMLAACVAFGVQLLLLNMGAHVAVSVLVSVAVAAWAVVRWRDGDAAPSALSRRLAPVLVFLLLVRFAVPLLALGNEAVYRVFLDREYTEAKAEISRADQPATPAVAPAVSGKWWDPVLQWIGKGKATVEEVQNKVPQMQAMASRAIDHLLRLLAVFVLQTLVLPLLFLWGLWRLFGLLVGSALGRRPGG